MKTLTLLFSFSFLLNSAFGQTITFDDIKSLRIKGIGEVEEYLTKKGWNITDVQQKTDSSNAIMTFAYPKKAEFTVNLITFIEGTYDSSQSRLLFETTYKNLYLSILNRLKLLHFNLDKTAIKGKKVKKLYKNKDLAVLITTSNLMEDINDPIPLYDVLICSRYDFEEMMEPREFDY